MKKFFSLFLALIIATSSLGLIIVSAATDTGVIELEQSEIRYNLYDFNGDPMPEVAVSIREVTSDVDVSWKTSNSNVVEIGHLYSDYCSVKLKGEGVAVITAEIEVSGNIYSDSCVITVIDNSKNEYGVFISENYIELNCATGSRPYENGEQSDEIIISAIPADADISLYTEDRNIATVGFSQVRTENFYRAVVTSGAAGETNLVAEIVYDGITYTDKCKIKVNDLTSDPEPDPGYEEPRKYTLTLDPQGGTVNPESFTYSSNTVVVLPTPVKSEKITFDFNGGTNGPETQDIYYGCMLWVLVDTEKYVSYECGSTYVIGDSDETLRAWWDMVAEGELTEEIPVKEGSEFLGWAVVEGSSNVIYEPGEKISTDESKTLYAVWNETDDPEPDPGYEEPRKYTLTLDPQGGTVNPESFTYSSNTVVVLPTPVKSEKITFDLNGGTNGPETQDIYYGCMGWSLVGTEGFVDYECGSTYVIADSDETLYAYWDLAAQGKLTEEKPVKDGAEFLGWTTVEGSSDVVYEPGEDITLGKSKTLYAVWNETDDPEPGPGYEEPAKTYTLSFDANGGWGEPEDVNGITSYVIRAHYPIKEGYIFLGWSTDANALSATYTAGKTIVLDGNVTLYAVWQKQTAGESEIKTPVSCRIVSAPVKTSYTYKIDSEADLTGMIIEVTYSDGSKENITDVSKLEVKGFDTNSTGSKAVTVEYEGLTVQYNINVSYVWWQWIIMILLLGFLWY